MKLKHILPVIASLALASCGSTGSMGSNAPFVGKITMGTSVELPEEFADMAAQYEAAMPQAIQIVSDGTDFGVLMEGPNGMQRVVKTEEGMIYTVVGQDKYKQAFPTDEAEVEGSENIQVQKLEETVDVLGYTCNAYKIEMTGDMAITGEVVVYTTTDINFNPPAQSGVISIPPQAASQIDGTVLRIDQSMSQMGMDIRIIIQATSIEEGSEAALEALTLPEGEYIDQSEMMMH